MSHLTPSTLQLLKSWKVRGMQESLLLESLVMFVRSLISKPWGFISFKTLSSFIVWSILSERCAFYKWSEQWWYLLPVIFAYYFAAVGAKVPRMCLLQHISAEVGEGEGGWGEKLVKMGFRGDRPSVWAMQVRETLHAKTQGASMNTL